MEKIKAFLMRPMIRKPLHTFYQAGIPVFLAGMANVAHSFQNGGLGAAKAAGLALVIATGAAGISAVKTYFVSLNVK